MLKKSLTRKLSPTMDFGDQKSYVITFPIPGCESLCIPTVTYLKEPVLFRKQFLPSFLSAGNHKVDRLKVELFLSEGLYAYQKDSVQNYYHEIENKIIRVFLFF